MISCRNTREISQTLVTEIFKAKNVLAPEIMAEVSDIKKPHYNFCSEATTMNKIFETNYNFHLK